MKTKLSFLAIVLSFSAAATTIDSQTFTYDGSTNSVELILNTEKTHTEYMIEERQSVCFRQEIVGYRTVCSGGYSPYPGPRPFPGPRPYPSRSCWTQPIYRSVSYPCIKRVKVPYEVKDFDVNARAIIDVTNLSEIASPGEKIMATLNGDQLSFQATGSGKFFIVKNKMDIRASTNGSQKMIDALLAIELVEAGSILKALNASNVSIENDLLKLDLGSIQQLENIGLSVKILKTKFFGKDTVLLNRDLRLDEIELSTSNSGSTASVDMKNLGVILENGKFKITTKVFAKFNGNLMNSSQFAQLSTSQTLTYKN